jgi:SAM-dependent methyltransferase
MSDAWAKKHQQQYAGSDWIDKPSLFAQEVIGYFPKAGKVLELGAGQGQDSRFFAEQGYEVVSTDLEQKALDLGKKKLPAALSSRVAIQQLDIATTFPFEDAMFEGVYAHLALHYFDSATTQRIFDEIGRVLKPGGVLAFLVNSTSDPEKSGIQLESNFYQDDKFAKRFFDVESAAQFTVHFSTILLDNNGETYKDMTKGVHNLIRFIGKKGE